MEQIQHLYGRAIDLATNSRHSGWMSSLLLLADGLLTGVIVRKIPYTEIDWVAYMQQIAIYRSGERDYANIKGQTGPLVYPAGHVLIYDALYRLTDDGTDIFRAQCIFTVLYLATLSVVMACYRRAKAPPYLFALLILSKRLHSTFVLRLFNDCFAVLGLFSALYCIQTGWFAFGSLLFSFAASIKMSILLAAPALGLVLLQALPPKRAINSFFLMAQIQFLLAVPFLTTNWRSYIGRAFQLTRQFLFKWTVNWRFVGEKRFLSPEFSFFLLAVHGCLLLLFAFTRWTRPSGVNPFRLILSIRKPRPQKLQDRISQQVTPRFIMNAILSCLIIGLLCARSLHYQFYAYIAWSSPYLLWASGMPVPIILVTWAAQEWAWNVYPSTRSSSMVVVGCLAVQTIGVWFESTSSSGDINHRVKADEHEDDHVD